MFKKRPKAERDPDEHLTDDEALTRIRKLKGENATLAKERDELRATQQKAVALVPEVLWSNCNKDLEKLTKTLIETGNDLVKKTIIQHKTIITMGKKLDEVGALEPEQKVMLDLIQKLGLQ